MPPVAVERSVRLAQLEALRALRQRAGRRCPAVGCGAACARSEGRRPCRPCDVGRAVAANVRKSLRHLQLHDLLRPRRSVAGHRRRRRDCASRGRCARSPADPAGMTAYGTSVGYLPLRAWIAEQHGVEPEQVIVTNGSMQADAFLFDALVAAAATRWSSSGRPTTARCCRCATAARDVRTVELEPDGHRRRRAGAACSPTALRPEAGPHHPQLPEPGRLHALGRQARAAARAGPRARLHGVRGRPVRRAALRGRAAADDALDGRRDASSTRRRSPRPCARGSASATWSGPRS